MTNTRTQQLFVIRAMFLLTPAVFGAVTWYLYAHGRQPLAAAHHIDYVTLGLWVVATITVMVLRRRYAAARTLHERVVSAILGWAAGEIAGLAGAVQYFASGNPQRFAFGMLVFVIALLMFPVPRE